MSKLVDKERLAKLAAALDARMKAAVKAEEERAMAAEQAVDAKADANAAAIAAINNEENGVLAQAKAHAQGLVDGEKGRAEEQEGLLAGRIDKLEGIVGTDGEAGALGKVIANVAENTAAIEVLNGAGEGSVAKAVADAVKAEEDRAKGVEAGFETRIAANEAFVTAQPNVDEAQNDRLALLEEMMGLGGTESDKTAIEELQEAIDSKVAQADYDAKVTNFEGRIAANEAFVAAHDDTARDARIKALEDDAPVKQAAIEAAQDAADAAQADVDAVEQRLDAEGGLVDRIEANEANIARLDGAVNVEGSVKKQIKDAIDAVNQAAGDLEDRVAANETFVAGYAAKEQKVREDFAAADATNLQAAKNYADQQITALVNSAPEAMNTLKELADAIEAHGNEYEAYVSTVTQNIATAKAEAIAQAKTDAAAADATLKTALQKEIDDDVLVETNRAKGEEARIEAAYKAADSALEEKVNKKIADDIAAAKTLISAEIDADVKAEADRAKAEEAAIRQELATEKAALQAEIDADVKVVADALADEKNASKDGSLAKKIADEVARATAEEADIRADFAAADTTLQTNINKKVDQSAYDTKVAELEQDIQANTNAIAQEATDRDTAIAEALEAYSTTDEMKAVIGNVVNSLALTMENDQVVLKLGGVDGIALTSVSLDMATDKDIDDIIAGLDAE